jgi:non-specific serine/threonine protein kinase/serine/threonine-protein kinase
MGGGPGIAIAAACRSKDHQAGMDTKEVIARFEQERQALALYGSSNIAKVLDAGSTPSGGRSSSWSWCAGSKSRSSTVITKTSQPSSGSKLFITVCHGVQHAHQKGIIHRDLKPFEHSRYPS